MKAQNSFFDPKLLNESIKQAFVKLHPKIMFRNPVMFTVEIATVIMGWYVLVLLGKYRSGQSWAITSRCLLSCCLRFCFANFAESLAEARGKAQADSLRKNP